MGNSPAVFIDRDGVLVVDAGLVTHPNQLVLMPKAPSALGKLKRAGYKLVVITNQSVVARGLITEAEVAAINGHLDKMLHEKGASPLDGWYFCPHHPSATLPAYRAACDCRKPSAGMLHHAAREHSINLRKSYMVGDRLTDIMAGQRAGCRTVLVQTGKHDAPLIETASPVDTSIQADYVCSNLEEAAAWIMQQS